MLGIKIRPQFPLAGSHAWLRPEEGRDRALPVRIVQHVSRDGTVFVAARERPPHGEEASANRRVQLAELAESADEAMLPLPVKKPRKPRRRKAK